MTNRNQGMTPVHAGKHVAVCNWKECAFENGVFFIFRPWPILQGRKIITHHSGSQKRRGTETQKHRDTETPKRGDTEEQRRKGSETQ